MGHIVRVNLGKNDDVIKTWWQLALSEGKNVSGIITRAIYYYDLTGEYTNLGNISIVDKTIGNARKTVFLNETDSMLEIIEKWMSGNDENNGLGPTIKRIVRRGISEDPSKENQIVELDDLIDRLTMVKNGKKPDALKIPKEPEKPAVKTEEIIKTQEVREPEKAPEPIAKPATKSTEDAAKKNFMLSMTAKGCGLGE